MSKAGRKPKDADYEHGNSFKNNELNHLYEIWDGQEEEVFKYGISDEPIGADGLSERIRRQVKWLNIVADRLRYIGRILIFGIVGKEKAERIEDEYMDAFEAEHGRLPKGNLRRNRKKEQ